MSRELTGCTIKLTHYRSPVRRFVNTLTRPCSVTLLRLPRCIGVPIACSIIPNKALGHLLAARRRRQIVAVSVVSDICV